MVLLDWARHATLSQPAVTRTAAFREPTLDLFLAETLPMSARRPHTAMPLARALAAISRFQILLSADRPAVSAVWQPFVMVSA
jgi:hypothetical protein